MDIPECAGLKAKYDSCFKNWKEECWREKTIKAVNCDEVFQVKLFSPCSYTFKVNNATFTSMYVCHLLRVYCRIIRIAFLRGCESSLRRGKQGSELRLSASMLYTFISSYVGAFLI